MPSLLSAREVPPSQLCPRDVQRMLQMGPFSGSDMYIILSTKSPAGYEAATFGFKGKIIQITKPSDVADLIDDKQAVLISNGDVLFSNVNLLSTFLNDRAKNRHRHLVVIHRQGNYEMMPVIANRFIHIRAEDPVSNDRVTIDNTPWPSRYELVERLMVLTEDAYMRGHYGERRWEREIRKLLDRNMTFHEVQAVMRSKYPRWAEETMSLDYLFGECPDLLTKESLDNLVGQYNDLADQ